MIRIPASYEILASFKSRIAITSERGQYWLQWHDSKMGPEGAGYVIMSVAGRGLGVASGAFVGAASFSSNVATGQTVTGTIIGAPGPLAPASAKLTAGETIHGMITLQYSTGPAVNGDFPTAKIAVGSFTITIP